MPVGYQPWSTSPHQSLARAMRRKKILKSVLSLVLQAVAVAVFGGCVMLFVLQLGRVV